jgi:hypothetical protein
LFANALGAFLADTWLLHGNWSFTWHSLSGELKSGLPESFLDVFVQLYMEDQNKL